MDLTLVVPMAGRWTRFRQAGFDCPKWSLPFVGRTVLANAVAANVQWVQRVIFAARAEDARQADVLQILDDASCGLPWDVVPIVATVGQADTVIQASAAVTGPMLVVNCDVVVEVEALPSSRFGIACADASIFPVTAPEQMSYASLDAAGRIVNVVEKRVVSDMIVTGLYYVGEPSVLREAFAESLARRAAVAGEYYLSPLFASLPDVFAMRVLRFIDLGTPEAYREAIVRHEDHDGRPTTFR